MATQADINAHDQLITDLAAQFGNSLEQLLPVVVLSLANIDFTDRTALVTAFEPVRELINNNIQGLDQLAINNLELNNVSATTEIENTVTNLKTASSVSMDVALNNETNNLVDELVVAALLGTAVGAILVDFNNRIPAIIKRLTKSFDQTMIKFTSVLSRSLGGQLYKYVGGVIPSSRPFCTQHNNNTYTEAEINRIWSGVWQGKAPGDPFVVRGGYNCRHFFILEE